MTETALADRLRGPAFMTFAMACFALEDFFLKSALEQISVGLTLVIFGAGGTLIFAGLARARGDVIFPAGLRSTPLVLRSLAEVGGRLFYTLAFALAPLSLVSSILQAAPLVVAAGAVVFFGERVGWRRWTAITVGFIGVLIILRPWQAGLPATAIFALLGMLGFALRDLATRASPVSMTNAQLGVAGFTMLILAGLIMMIVTGPGPLPDGRSALFLGLATLVGVLAYGALTQAMRVGEVSLTVPWRYTRLVFAMLLAVIVLGERPDGATLLGAAIIVLSGLYTLRRSAQR
jgi:drug/metabolite transporter (DMT)-like permease